MADLSSTKVFGKLTVMHDAIMKANVEIVGGLKLGKSTYADNLNTTYLPGFYETDNGTANNPDNRTITGVLVAADSARSYQIQMSIDGDLRFRAGDSNSWNSWRDVYHTGNSDSFSSTGTYSGLRAQATTKDDVGLGNVRNVDAYAKTEFTDQDTADTPMKRNASGDVWARLFRSSYASTNSDIGAIYTTRAPIGGDYMRPSTPAQVKAALSMAPSDLSQAGATTDQVLAWDGSQWSPADGGGGGGVVWSSTAPADTTVVWVRPEVINANVYTGSAGKSIRKLDPTGSLVWEKDTGYIIYSIAVNSEGLIVVGLEDGVIKIYNPDGSVNWGHSVSSTSYRIEGVDIDSQGNVYTASTDNSIYKFDTYGNIVWSISGSIAVNDVAVDAAGYVYYGDGNDGDIHKVNPNGDLVWSNLLNTGRIKGVAVDADGYVYVAGGDGTVRKIDSSGNEVWSFTGHGSSVESVAVDVDGYVYSGGKDETVRKIDPNGNQVWSYTGHTAYIGGVSVDRNKYVYSGSNDYFARKIDSDGNEVWSTEHTSPVYTIAADPGVITPNEAFIYNPYNARWESIGPLGGAA